MAILEGPSIKDSTHQRQSLQKVYPVISFTAETKFVDKKEKFLSRHANKQKIKDAVLSIHQEMQM